MNGPWIALLNKLPLARTEREVVKRFEADPDGRTFLPIADILRSHRLQDESLELLTQGVDKHPSFTVARVVLARELLQKGLVENAWRTLESSPTPLNENILAQKLRYRLAILMGFESTARSLYQHMQLNQMVDVETKRLADVHEVTSFLAARERLVKEFQGRGTEVVLPAAPTTSPDGSAAALAGDARADDTASLPVPSYREASLNSAYLDADGIENDRNLAGFHVVPLDEIFRAPADGSPSRAATGSGIELDSTTLADIYAGQGHYTKALSVYRRLLRLTPGNDLLRRKVADLARLEREQKNVDLTIDPSVVDRMESVEIIDRQIRFYNELLGKLI